MKRLSDSSKGFTLIELMVAISLLAIGLMATVSMQEVAIRADSISNRLSTGAGIAQQVTEELLSKNINDPVFQTGKTYTYQFDEGGGNFKSTLAVQGAETYIAEVTVTHDDVVVDNSRIDITVMFGGGNKIVATYTTFKRLQ